MQIREILNKIVWDPKLLIKKGQFFIQYTHRGVPGDKLIISCDLLTTIFSDSFEFLKETENEPVRIPFHRIEKIFNHETNEILYLKR